MKGFVRLKKFLGFGKKSRRRKNLERLRRLRERMEARADEAPPARRETLVAIFAGANLIFTPWAVAGQPLWAQWVSLGLALPAFLCLFLPWMSRRSPPVIASWRALRRCFPFWAGLALMLLFLVQGLNPAYQVEFDSATWLVIPTAHNAKLPSGVASPFMRPSGSAPAGMNAFRTMLLFAGPWLTFCALWCGVFHRSLVRRLTFVVLCSAFALAVFAIGMRASQAQFLYGSIPVSLASTFGPFMYQNQASAFFCLMWLMCSTFVLTEWRAATSGRRTGGIHLPAAAGCVLLCGAALASWSFSAVATVVLALPVMVVAAYRIRRDLRGDGRGDTGLTSYAGMVVTACLMILVGALAFSGDFQGAVAKVRAKICRIEKGELDDRAPLREATRLMYRDAHPLWGYGAGSYRWVSPRYFAQVDYFMKDGRLAARAEYAHCDWLQILAEWGIYGLGVVIAGLVWLAFKLRLAIGRMLPHAWPLAVGLTILVLHAAFDYLIFNPAILMSAGFAAFYLRSRCRNATRAVVSRSIRR